MVYMVNIAEAKTHLTRLIRQAEGGERVRLSRHGKPVAEIVPFSDKPDRIPTWKQKGIQLQLQGSDLSSAILEDRKGSP